jgi:hypothetical protein
MAAANLLKEVRNAQFFLLLLGAIVGRLLLFARQLLVRKAARAFQ